MTNLFEILINAPQGLELYSPAFGKVYFQDVEDNLIESNSYPIIVIDENNRRHSFTENGNFLAELDTECILFPSKEHRNWDNWQEILFQVGDVVTSTETENTFIIIFKNDVGFNGIDKSNLCHKLWYKNYRYATPEEREQFMAELNANGYTWNADTKQIERIEQQYTPKYKVGDWIICTDTNTNNEYFYESDEIEPHQITSTKDNIYEIDDEYICYKTKEFDATTTIRLATEQELIDAEIKEKPFTIDDFKPTQFVLARDWNDQEWCLDIYSRKNANYNYVCIHATWDKCIPYNDETKHLLGTTDDCPEKYKTW